VRAYGVAYFDRGSNRWRMLGPGKCFAHRAAAKVTRDRWVAHGYPAQVVRIRPRWTLTDVWNQVIVWASWVRS
jgi:hypothetical protein